MTEHADHPQNPDAPTRRRFLKQLGQGAVAAGAAGPLLADAKEPPADVPAGKIKYRTLGKTGLKVSEIGFGGHSWAYKRVPIGNGEYRQVNVDEATEMIRVGLDMGVNWLDSCTALEESGTPGEALKRLKRRDEAVISVRVSHKMNGNENDKQEVLDWAESRMKLWQTDCIDVLMLCNTENDTPLTGYWDMSYSIEALEELKKQGKIRYTGFGCHFTPKYFLEAFEKFGDYFDVCSLPYNIRHRAAEEIMPEAKKKNMGIVTIKPFARGSLLNKKDLEGADKGLPRDMIRFVLENERVDCCTCGVHTVAQVLENFSASWTELTPAARERLDQCSAMSLSAGEHAWLEKGWLHA
ncbi:MAG TPA: aldo/keto reductase [Thermoguttaceae bacterium]|nr:aldo/keto reductase [Thermoguttaceae bacterium]